MNIFSRTRSLITATFVFAGLAAATAHAQSIFVNGSTAPCPTATVMFGAGIININTAGCTGTVATPPSISSVSPSSGQPGAPVVISGANMSGATVTIGGLAAGVTGNTGTVITTSVPAGTTAASGGGVVVTVAGLAPASIAFAVLNPPPAAPPSITSVTPTSGAADTVVTISGASLSGATVTIGGLPATITSNTGTVLTTSVPKNATAASVGGGVVTVGTFPTATFGFIVLAPPAPTITSVTPASASAGTSVTISGSGFSGASVNIGGATASITTSSANSITTIVPANAAIGPGTIVVTNATASASFAYTVNAIVAGCNDVSEDGIPLGCVTKQPTSVVASAPRHNGLNGAGPDINAYSMGATRCLTTPPLTKSWQHNIDLMEYKRNAIDVFLLNANESLSYKFTVPTTTDTTGGFSYGEAAASGGSYPPVFMSITSAPCDFDTSKVASGPAQNYCYQSGIAGLAMGWTTVPGVSLPQSYCRLKKGATYYMNIRFQDARPASEGGSPTRDSCSSSPCGGVLQVL